MNQKLFEVEDCFKVPGRGTVIVGKPEPTSPIFKTGNTIILIKPDAAEVITKVGGLEMIRTVSDNKKIGILVKNISKEEIPIGTQVFLKM